MILMVWLSGAVAVTAAVNGLLDTSRSVDRAEARERAVRAKGGGNRTRRLRWQVGPTSMGERGPPLTALPERLPGPCPLPPGRTGTGHAGGS